MTTAEDRFWSKVRPVSTLDECWLWSGHTSKGYGRFMVDGRVVRAHRWIYQQLIADIPDGLVIDHLCRVRQCVNPWHLEPVTSRVNTMRGDTVAAAHAAKTHCVHGHPLSGDNVAVDTRGWRNCLTCRRVRNEKAGAAK